jgi:hypothetical protein
LGNRGDVGSFVVWGTEETLAYQLAAAANRTSPASSSGSYRRAASALSEGSTVTRGTASSFLSGGDNGRSRAQRRPCAGPG